MIKFALPGIDTFLEDVLEEENLSEKGEKIRLDFVKIFDELGSTAHVRQIVTSQNSEQKQSPGACRRRSRDDDLYTTHSYEIQTHWDERETAVVEDKVFIYLNI